MADLIRTGRTVLWILAAASVAACDGGTAVPGGQEISLNLRVAGAGSPAAAQVSGPAAVAGPPLELAGTNGTLTLDEIRIIIDEVELHREDPGCDASEMHGDDTLGSGEDDSMDSSEDDSMHDGGGDCGEFEGGPRFMDLPLDGAPVEAVSAEIPAGTYDRLDFEIEDLEDDADDSAEAAQISELRADILAEIPDWPRKASAMVSGSFAPADGGDAVEFRVFIEAEIEIEMELIPNLVVDDAGTRSREVTVDVAPQTWFSNPDGTVVELQQYDYDATGALLELEVEMERGFTEVELDD